MAIDKLRVRNILVKQLGVEEEAADALTYALAEPLESDTDLAIGGFEERTSEQFAGLRRDFQRHEVENRQQFETVRSDLQRHEQRIDQLRHEVELDRTNSDRHWNEWFERYDSDRALDARQRQAEREADARQRQAEREADAGHRESLALQFDALRELVAAHREADAKQRETDAELRAAERRADLIHYERMTWRVVAAALGGAAAIAGLATVLIRLL